MPETLTEESDPRIQKLFQNIMNQGADQFEMVSYKGIRVIKEPKEGLNVMIEIDVVYEDQGREYDATLRAGWKGEYEELFKSSERKTKMLKYFYSSTYDLINF